MDYFHAAKRHFLACHQHPLNQAIHHFTNLLAFLAIALLFYDWRISLILLIVPQPIVWMGHAVFEKNQPAFVKFPGITIAVSLLWSIEHLFGLRDLWNYWQRSHLSH
ncbi:MAG: Mpo1-like protein [Synechococcales bacterium]|nr:Mpo1-like protein [Synechococcales bacterium]